jgi:cytochrome c-type biogenesis protein CcmH
MTPSNEALEQQLKQLQALRDSGGLSEEAFVAARQALQATQPAVGAGPAATAAHGERADEQSGAGATRRAATPRPTWRMQGGLLVAVVALAVVGYNFTGAPDAAVVGPVQPSPTELADAEAAGQPLVTPEQVTEIVDRLAQRLKDSPGDLMGWTLLARAYSSLGRHADAAPAYQKALALSGDDAGLLADYADTLAALNGGQFNADALKAVDRALALEPTNIKALALAGSAAFDRRDYLAAVGHWEVVERILPPDASILPQVRDSIAQARQLGGLPPASPTAALPLDFSAPASPSNLSAPAATAATALAGSVSGQVSLAPALAARVSPEDTVFIFARPAEGPRMPLAVLRKQVRDLPLSFTLDDSMAMAPGATLSGHSRIVVSARISKSGQAIPQAGDLSGQSPVVAPGAQGLTVQISEVVATP